MDAENEDEIATALVPRPAAALVSAAPFVVTVLEGPERGETFALDPKTSGLVLVGQSVTCRIRLSDRGVSRRHASILQKNGGLLLRDLSSTNGTYVDGVRVIEAWVHAAGSVRLGNTTLRFDRVGEPMPVEPSGDDHFGRLIGASLEMRCLYPLARNLAGSMIPIVIEGETGTGKEVLAEAIHEASPRKNGPYVVFDCTASPATLIESELFGHERGAFTGATELRKGVFEQAHGGSLLIDEVGDLPLALQSRLLRVIDRGEFRRVGGDRWQRVDVRLIAATRRDLDHEVAEGRFRDDLFHRLAVGRLELPPLRRREGDIRRLVEHFAKQFGETIPPQVLARWEEEPWPGNVRELRNAVARAAAFAGVPRVGQQQSALGPAPRAGDVISTLLAARLPLAVARMKLVEEFERLYVEQALIDHDGDVARAAEAAGIVRRYFNILRSRYKT